LIFASDIKKTFFFSLLKTFTGTKRRGEESRRNERKAEEMRGKQRKCEEMIREPRRRKERK
jgi:hypothetical protein